METIHGASTECRTLPLESLTVSYREGDHTTSFASLPSALASGCDALQKDEVFFFSTLTPQPVDFVLPLVLHSGEGNTVATALGFFFLRNVRGSTLFLRKEDGGVLSVFCTTESLILHACSETLNVIQAYSDNPTTWRYLTLNCYHHVTPMESRAPYCHTPQSAVREKVVEEAIRFDTPTLFAGGVTSGKTTTVLQYCQRALLPFRRVQCNVDSTVASLVSGTRIEANGLFACDGPFKEAYSRGSVLLLENMDALSQDVLRVLTTAVTNKRLFFDSMGLSVEETPHRFFRLLATTSAAVPATLSRALRVVGTEAFPPIALEETNAILSACYPSETKEVSDVCAACKKTAATPTIRDAQRLLLVARQYESVGKVSWDEALRRAVHVVLQSETPTAPIIPSDDVVVKYDQVDGELLREVNDGVTVGLEAGCPVLVVSDEDYTARKYLQTLLHDRAEFVPCSSTSTVSSLLGGYRVENHDPVPRFVSSPLLSAVTRGGTVVLYRIDKASRVVSCLHSVLEVNPKDAMKPSLQLNESLDHNSYAVNAECRIVATATTEGVASLSSELLNRFLVVRIGGEDATKLRDPVEVAETDEQKEASDLLASHSLDYAQRLRVKNMLEFLHVYRRLSPSAALVETILAEDYAHNAVLSSLFSDCPLLKGVGSNRAIAFFSAQSAHVNKVLAALTKVGSQIFTVFSLSPETSFDTLMGGDDVDGHHHHGALYTALTRNDIIVFDHAEHMSSDLADALFDLFSPLTSQNSVLDDGDLHPSFRVIFFFHSEPRTLPSFFHIDRCSPSTESEAVQTSVCKRLCPYVPKGVLTLNEVLMLDKVLAANAREEDLKEELLTLACLADRPSLHSVVEEVVSTCVGENLLDSEASQDVLTTLKAQELTAEPRKKKCDVTRGTKRRSTNMDYEAFVQADKPVQRAAFTASLTQYKRLGIPLLCVGDERTTRDVVALLLPDSAVVELSSSMTIDDAFCEGVSLPVADGEEAEGGEKRSRLVYRYGLLTDPMRKNSPIHITNLHLVSEPLRSRLLAFLTNAEKDAFTWFEAGTDFESLDAFSTVPIIITSSPEEYSRIPQRDRFLSVFCQQAGEVSSVEASVRQSVEACFVNASASADLFLRYINASKRQRTELLTDTPDTKSLFVDEEPLLPNLDELASVFIPEVLESMKAAVSGEALIPARTTIRILLTVALGAFSHLPVVLEGAESVGKTTAALSYLRANHYTYKHVMLSSATRVDSLFGSTARDDSLVSFLSASEEPRAIVFDCIAEVSCSVLYHLRRLLACSVSHMPFSVPGVVDSMKLPPLCIVVCSNSSQFSASQEPCIVFRDIEMAEKETVQIFSQLAQCEPSLVSAVCLRDATALKKARMMESLCQTDSSLKLQALWLLFACDKDESDCERIESELTQHGMPTPARSDAFTWSENRTANALSVGVELRQPLILVGPSPSGKSYVLSAVARRMNRHLRVVVVDEELCPENVLKGAKEREMSENAKPLGVVAKALKYGDWLAFENCECANAELEAFFHTLCTRSSSEIGKDLGIPVNPAFRLFFLASTRLSLPCVAIRCDSIATSHDVRSICLARHTTCNPSWFGDSEARAFYASLRVLASSDGAAFRRELGHEPEEYPCNSGFSVRSTASSALTGSVTRSSVLDSTIHGNALSKEPMDALFSNALRRGERDKDVRPLPASDALVKIILASPSIPLDSAFSQCVFASAARLLSAILRDGCGCKPFPAVTIIIDVNCSVRQGKARLRTLVVASYLVLLKTLGVAFSVFVACGRKNGAHIANSDSLSLSSLFAFVRDLEKVQKLPSAPLDVAASFNKATKALPVVVFGDGVSEQLLSQRPSVRRTIGLFKQLFLVCVVGQGEEALSPANQSQLESLLRSGFGENVVMVRELSDFANKASALSRTLFSSTAEPPLTPVVENAEAAACVWKEVWDPVCYASLRYIQARAPSSSGSIPPVTESLPLRFTPVTQIDRSIACFERLVEGNCITDALRNAFFPPNAFAPSTAALGRYLDYSSYARFVTHHSPKGQVYLASKLTACAYSCSVVVDCSALAFCPDNTKHSLQTLFTLLSSVASLQLPSVDLWVASDRVLRVATGVSSEEVWTSTVLWTLYHALSRPVLHSALDEAIRYAWGTCSQRGLPAVMFVCTNGVLNPATRSRIQSMAYYLSQPQCSFQCVGVGLGLHVHCLHDVFPRLVWCADPARLGECLESREEVSVSEMNAVKVVKEDVKEYDVVHAECIEKINALVSSSEDGVDLSAENEAELPISVSNVPPAATSRPETPGVSSVQEYPSSSNPTSSSTTASAPPKSKTPKRGCCTIM